MSEATALFYLSTICSKATTQSSTAINITSGPYNREKKGGGHASLAIFQIKGEFPPIKPLAKMVPSQAGTNPMIGSNIFSDIICPTISSLSRNQLNGKTNRSLLISVRVSYYPNYLIQLLNLVNKGILLWFKTVVSSKLPRGDKSV